MLTQLYDHSTITTRLNEMAHSINKTFEGAPLLHVVITLNGAFMFGADLVRLINVPLIVHFVTTTAGTGIEKGVAGNNTSLPSSFGNHPVLIVEDVVDAGKTLDALRPEIAKRFSGDIRSVALLKRQGGCAKVDFYGFTLPRGLFVVGYGMDMDGRYRELRDLNVYGNATMSASQTTGMC